MKRRAFLFLALLTATPAFAQTGIIAFGDDCTRRLYAMRGDGSGRIELPFPPLLQPNDVYVQPLVLDVTTGGPPTIVYYVGLGHAPLQLYDFGLFAVQVDDTGGGLSAHAPVRLSLPVVVGINPNLSRRASFSPIALGDRLALATITATGVVLLTARVERDGDSKITGLTDLVVVGDLHTLAGVSPPPGFTGDIDYASDGGSIVASIKNDLWRIFLAADNTFLAAQPLTPGSDGFVQWNPSFSPDGSRIAHTGGALTSSGGVQGKDADIYSLSLVSGAVLPVTTSKNKGDAASGRNNGRWSPDGTRIAFSAYTSSRVPRSAPCSDLVNSDIFVTNADGSTVATRITDTNGTSVEVWPRWGW